MKLQAFMNNSIIPKLKSEKFAKFIIYLVYTLILYERHQVGYVSDDIYTVANVGSYSLYEYFIYLMFFNGRIATDLFANVWYRFDIVYWRIFDTSVYVLIAMLISRIFTKNNWRHVIVVCGLVLLFPFNYMSSAGYIATSANYIYPVAAILIVLRYVTYILEDKKVPLLMYPVTLLAILYATNHDQTALVLAVGFLFYAIYCKVIKAPKRLTRNAAGLCIISTVSYILYCMIPGHIARMSGTTLNELRWLPEYAEWTFLDKVYHGYATTVANLFYNDVDIFTVFAILLVIVSLRQKSPIKMFVGFVPFAGIVISNFMGKNQFISYPENCYGMTELMLAKYFFVPFFLSILMLVCIFLAVWFNVEKMENKLFLTLLLVLAAGTREMMGFTPTIYASSYRTFTFFLFALIACCIILLNELEEDEKYKDFWYVGLGSIVAFISM